MTSSPSSARSAAHLRVDGISKTFGYHRVLSDVSFTVAAGRTGVIGENGSGKSTLLRIIAGLVEADGGTVSASIPTGHRPRIGLLHQEPPFPRDATIAEALESAVAPVRSAAAAVETTGRALGDTPEDRGALTSYSTALETAENVSAWDLDARISAMLIGLDLAGLAPDRRTARLSGGQRSRLSLAWLLLSEPDVLLLDEPTNHLDDGAAQYLREILTGWSGPVLIASHDRAFLDDVVTSLIDLDPAPLPQAVAGPLVGDGDGTGIGVTRFTGRYTDYLHARLDARERWEHQHREEQAHLTRLRASVSENYTVGHEGRPPRTEARVAAKFYSDRNAKTVSRRVNDARTRLEELEARQIRKPPRGLRFQGLTAATKSTSAGHNTSDAAIDVTQAAVHGRLTPTSLIVGPGDKWLITGSNGAGKSTLLDLMAGRLAPTSGTVTTAPSLRVGLLTQDADVHDPNQRGAQRTTRQAYEDLVGPERTAAVPLHTFGLISARDENRPLHVLSVGQQRRLALAVVLADPPDLLLLDEPTNHFSVLLASQIEARIPDYPGAVVIASHDRWLRRTWRGHRLDLPAP